MEAEEYLCTLTNTELIQLSKEIMMCPIPEDALMRKVVKHIYGVDESLILVYALGLGVILSGLLGERLSKEIQV